MLKEKEWLSMLNRRKMDILDEVLEKEKQIYQLDYLRYEINKVKIENM